MIYKKKSDSSKRWLLEHFKDKYVIKSKENNIRSRAWFKLEQIDKKNNLFQNGMRVIDLGASPGSWTQYALSKIGKNGRVTACDILPMKPIIGINFLKLDCRKKKYPI